MPISKKQQHILAFPYTHYDALICDGAIRSGKTSLMMVSFVDDAMRRFSGQRFGICGKTVDSAVKNIIAPYLPMSYANDRYSIKWRRTDKLLIVSNGKVENTFEIFGGKDESSYALIQGRTLAGVLFDEVALQPRSFVEQALARCSVDGSKFWFNCNPASPHHWFKEQWIDKAKEKNACYLHFSLDDNPSLTDKIKERYKSLYVGVFYERYILGEWKNAEGLIYPMFDEKKHAVTECPFPLDDVHFFASCDYGTNNPFALGIFARSKKNGIKYHMIAEYYHDGRKNGQKTDSDYANDIIAFFEAHNVNPEYLFVDPSASSFIVEMRKRGLKVMKANNDVHDGIIYVSEMLKSQCLTIGAECRSTIEEFNEYIWDDKAAEHGEDKPVKAHDHAMDMIRYALYSDRHNAMTRSNHTRRDGAV